MIGYTDLLEAMRPSWTDNAATAHHVTGGLVCKVLFVLRVREAEQLGTVVAAAPSASTTSGAFSIWTQDR